MDRTAFDALIRRLEVTAKAKPRAYRLRVGSFAILGYVVYAAIVVLGLGLLAGLGALVIYKPSFWVLKLGWKLGIPLALFVVGLFRALRVTFPEPEGIVLGRDGVPALFAILDDLSRRLSVPELDDVLATDDYNASVMQRPRWGLFGKQNHLMVGIPLMQSLSTADFRAVLAHEFGHLSGNHSRFSGWVYQVVRMYAQVLEQSGGNRALAGFLGWYVPRLDALSFPLRRANEYEADAAAAEIVGSERTGQALANVHARGAVQGPFWRAIEQQMPDSPHPPASPFTSWSVRVAELETSAMEKALSAALVEQTGTADTHPSLKDRLEALGATPRVEPAPDPSAAQDLLGERYEYCVEQIGRLWSSRVDAAWKAEHERLRQARERLHHLESERQARTLSTEEAFEYSQLAEEAFPERDALPLYRKVLERDPDHIGARFSVARLLLQRDDAEGEPLMKALQSEPQVNLRLAANALLSAYYERRGEQESAARSEELAQRAAEEMGERARQREEIRASDTFVQHGLAAEAVRQLGEVLELFLVVKGAYLVQKLLADGEPPLFVVGIEVSMRLDSSAGQDLAQQIAERLSLPGEAWVVCIGNNRDFRSRLKAVTGSFVYTRD